VLHVHVDTDEQLVTHGDGRLHHQPEVLPVRWLVHELDVVRGVELLGWCVTGHTHAGLLVGCLAALRGDGEGAEVHGGKPADANGEPLAVQIRVSFG